MAVGGARDEVRIFIDIELDLMTCSDVKLACCRLCKKPLASNLGECIHCGVCNPIEKDKCSLLHKVLLALLVVGTILAAFRYDGGVRIEPGCTQEGIDRRRGC